MEKRKKIGLLGGNFNPIHYAHLMIADQVAQRLQLDQVLFLPENLPPHIDQKETIAAKDRIAMLQLAIQSNPKFSLELCEIERGGKSYTFDTMTFLTQKHPDCDYYFIIGSDMVDYLPKWYKIDELIKLTKFVAIKRSETVRETAYPVIWLEAPLMPISSTMIREMLTQNIEPNYLLPQPVLEYINTHNIYTKKA